MLVTKRDGSQEEYCVNKIKKCISWATNGLNVNPLELESKLSIQLKDTISTFLIHENSIQEALKLCTLESPDWRYVAGRLLLMAYLKKVSLGREVYTKGSFLKSIKDKVNNCIYSSQILETYTDKDINYYESFIIPDRDFDYDYAGVFALLNKYLVADELPQEMYLVVAMYLASNESNLGRRDELVENIYNALSLRKLSLATPLLSNLRKPNGNLSSCFVLGIEDNIESIFDAVKDISLISKNGGGVGCLLSRIRASGSSVKGNANASGGIVPFAKIINDTGLAINQLGKRAAAITIGLDVWHLDILDFLHLQTEDGDQRRKAFDIFPQVIVPDLFMEAVQTNDDWLIFDPFEVREKTGYDFPKLWGVKFEVAYKHLKEIIKIEDNIKNFKILKAKNIWLRILKTQVETGLPYIFFKDTTNKYNPNKDSGFIGQTNLCVSGETKILTDKGHVQISDLVNQEVNIWNGSEWSNVTIKQTGTDKPLLKIHFSNGESLECTYYHNFWVQKKYNSKPEKVEAQDLKVGDKLIKYNLPVVSNESDIEFPYAYTSGVFSGDGSVNKNGSSAVYLYGIKKELVPYLDIRNKRQGSKYYSRELDSIATYDDVKQDRIRCDLPLDIPAKFTVPLKGYTIESRLNWLAGLLDTDGCVQSNGSNQSIVISSIHKKFLLDIRLMLQTLGVDSKVISQRAEGMNLLPDGKGGSKEYLTKELNRLLISSNGLYQLILLGFKTNRLKWEERKPQREAHHFIKVTQVEHTYRVDDTYCCNEPKKHLIMCNGILVGNCTESSSNFEPDKYTHCCNLVSINLANMLDSAEEKHIATLAVIILEAAIDLTEPPIPEAKAHNEYYRTIGVGFMGLADWLVKNNANYYIGKTITKKLFERYSFYCIEASVELAKKYGSFGAFEKSEWAKGNLLGRPLVWFLENTEDPEKWLELSNKVKEHGIRHSQLMAVAPNTSTSLLQGCTASILPPYNLFFYDSNAKGKYPIVPPYYNEESKWYYTENVKMDQKVLVDFIAEAIVPYIDSAVSMELNFNQNLKGLVKPKFISDTIFLAWKKECKTVYYVRSIPKKNSDDCVSCSG